MSACARSPRLWRSASLLLGAAAALTLGAAPAMAHDDDAAIATTHTVQQGDYLAAIADEHGIADWVAIYAVNDDVVDNPDLLMVGQELAIPANPGEVDVAAVELPADAPAPEPDAPAEPEAGTQETAETAEPTETADAAPAGSQPSQAASGGTWDRLAQCESNGDWSINTGNGFYGGLQFHPQTWAGHGGHEFAPNAHLASRAQEIVIAERVLASQGWGAWPACSAQMGLR